MPLLDFGMADETGVNGPYADYDTALAALRAGSFDDGDAFVLSNGLLYAAWTSTGPGILLAPDDYRLVEADGTGHVVNASGEAYWTIDDALAAVTGRGFTTGGSGSGTVTKAAPGPLVLDMGAVGSGSANITFTATTQPLSCLIVAKIGSGGITDDGQNSARFIVRNSDKEVRASLHGDFQLIQNTTVDIGYGDLTYSAGDWITVRATMESGNQARLGTESDPSNTWIANYADLAANAADLLFFTVGSSGGAVRTVARFDEMHFLEV